MESDRFDMSDLAAAMNGHQVTDENGQLVEEQETVTPAENPAASEEEVQVEETPQEKPVKEEVQSQQVPADVVEDESTGKKYVPEERFKEIYKKMKDLERQATSQQQAKPASVAVPSVGMDKTEALETEMLFATMPEFDPNNSGYSRELDQLGAMYFNTGQAPTKLAAARMAREFMKSLASKQETVRTETRNFKSFQADSGLTSRPSTRTTTQVDPDKMSVEEMESYLRSTGQW